MTETPRFPSEVDPGLAELILRTARAKLMAGALYMALRDRAPGAAELGLTQIAVDEETHAAALRALLGAPPAPGRQGEGRLVGCNPMAETWPSGLMAAFALDQAATASLIALSTARDPRVAEVAERLKNDEAAHQTFALGAFRALAQADPALGLPLAKEMIADRDWVKEVYPRRSALTALVEAGLLTPDAPKRHDSFLGSLGDRIQDALGVLGEL